MTEARLRKWHRTMGIILALFIFMQAASGALLSLEELLKFHDLFGLFSRLHFWGGWPGHLYRVFLGLGVVGLATSGCLIFLKIRARTPKSSEARAK
ncbi:MAG: hypothetical protein JRI59_07185 [Deltaproteobacteria bacterium]|nr:hypothetical protein [Deltaproteobacteria bacterium]